MEEDIKSARYEIEREVGRGAMGRVFQARDTRLSRTVALKMLPAEVTDNSELLRRLAQEARAASAVNHPGIATVFDFEECGEESFIVYEFVQGETLRQRTAHQRLTPDEATELGIQMADALAAAHERGVIHRDLKPDNVIVMPGMQPPGRVKILDFGLAKFHAPFQRSDGSTLAAEAAAGTLTAPGLIVGTVLYMAPEQLAGEVVDHRADLYALGLVLYESLAGANPFAGSSPASTIANILTREAPPLAEWSAAVPLELDRIIRKCLRKKREERYSSARELLADLANLRNSRPTAADSATARPPTLAAVPDTPLLVGRRLARALFALIQVGYLIMYGVALSYFHELGGVQLGGATRILGPLVVLCAVCGIAVRLYFLAAVGFDHAKTGRQFRQAFPFILFLDLAWAAAPLFLIRRVGGLVLVFSGGLAYLPFSQRALLYSAYSPTGGPTSSSGVCRSVSA